jgi:anti-sigma B factor antagonist
MEREVTVTETESTERLTVRVARSGAYTSVVSLAGELDLSVIPTIEDRLFRECRSRPAIVVDLSGLTFIDSSGIALLIQAFRETKGELHTVVAPGSQVERVFAIAGIGRALPLFPSLDEAVEALAADPREVA